MVSLQRLSEKRSPGESEQYVTRHVQSVLCPGAKWRYPGVQIAADGLIGGQPGGDFYIAALGPHNEIALSVGTVTGGGLLATLCQVLAASLIHLEVRRGSSPVLIAHKVHRLLSRINADVARFPVSCSMFAALIDKRRETLEYCRAGGCQPFVQMRRGEWFELPLTCRDFGRASEADTDAHVFVLDARQIERLVVVTEGCRDGEGGTSSDVDVALVSSVPRGSASRQVHAMLAKVCRQRHRGALSNRDVSVVVADLRCNEESDAPATNRFRAISDKPRNRRNGRCQ